MNLEEFKKKIIENRTDIQELQNYEGHAAISFYGETYYWGMPDDEV